MRNFTDDLADENEQFKFLVRGVFQHLEPPISAMFRENAEVYFHRWPPEPDKAYVDLREKKSTLADDSDDDGTQYGDYSLPGSLSPEEEEPGAKTSGFAATRAERVSLIVTRRKPENAAALAAAGTNVVQFEEAVKAIYN
mmetsp:Transcript_1097/g.1350  ORF Transcript_1097/g.1350 Transcript_1097/m.1350 type:complete len:140 (-) Transcript_1097:243-662(-)